MTRYIAAAFAAAFIAGCGPDHKPPAGAKLDTAQPTSGDIKFPDGSPLIGGFITFSPVDPKGAGGSVRFEVGGPVDEKGHYKVGLAQDGRGAAVGEYKVTIKPRFEGELKESNSKNIPQDYWETSSSPLTAKVVEGPNKIDFELK